MTPDHNILGTDSYGGLAQLSVASPESRRFDAPARAWSLCTGLAYLSQRRVEASLTAGNGELPDAPKALE